MRLFSRRSFPDESKVVVKNWISADKETKKSLIKEARLLQNLRHANVVEFKGICTDQLSLLLEYAYFDFSPFGCDIQTHSASLAELLAVCEQSSCDGMNVAVLTHAAFDVASGTCIKTTTFLPSHPRFSLISVFYPFVRRPRHPSEHPPDIRPDIRPYPRFTLTLTRPPFANLLYVNSGDWWQVLI